MTTKERILALLEENRGTPLSGEVLAEELGVSRTAVWKAIKDLQKAGHAIAAAQNRGYTLDTDSEVLSEQGVRLFLRNKSLNLVVAQELESTNLTAKQMAAAGAPHGTLVVADSQTAGRGRRGRSFASPPGPGLYLSMVLRSALPMQSAVLVTSAAAVAVATPCWPAPVSAMSLVLPIVLASRACPRALLILWAPVWLRSSRLR